MRGCDMQRYKGLGKACKRLGSCLA